MKTNKLKIILVLSGTLIIGFALGMLTAAQIRNAHIKKFRTFASKDGFTHWTIHVIDPSPEQKEKISPVISKYAKENLALRKKYRNEFVSLMKAYQKELYPLLTKEQIQRLEKMTHPRGHRSPPRHGRGSGPNAPGKQHKGIPPCDFF